MADDEQPQGDEILEYLIPETKGIEPTNVQDTLDVPTPHGERVDVVQDEQDDIVIEMHVHPIQESDVAVVEAAGSENPTVDVVAADDTHTIDIVDTD